MSSGHLNLSSAVGHSPHEIASGNSGETNHLFGNCFALESKVSFHLSSEFEIMFVSCLYLAQLLRNMMSLFGV